MVVDGCGHHHLKTPFACLLPLVSQLTDSVQCRLGVERIETGLQQKKVAAAAKQGAGLFVVGFRHLVERHLPVGRMVHVGCQRQRLGSGTHRACHPDVAVLTLVCHAAGYPCTGECHLSCQVLTVIFLLGDAVGRERVGRDDVCTGGNIASVYLFDGLWRGDVQHVVVTCQRHFPVGEAPCMIGCRGESE